MSVVRNDASVIHDERNSEAYTIGVICALPLELVAVRGMLDEEHSPLPQTPNDSNLYYLGRVADHNIVITCLPAGSIGLVDAARVAMQMKFSFNCIQKGLMVGIGGGVPSEQHDIRLGDVVVSQPSGPYGGIVQYDLGKTHSGGVFERTGSLCPPPDALLAALNGVKVSQLTNKLDMCTHLSCLAERLPAYSFPVQLSDDLYQPDHVHKGGKSCHDCGPQNRVRREPRHNRLLPVVHYGTIASGNRVMKDAIERDKISQDLGGVLCFEMEAAALMNNFPCLVIRGISDYSDSHKNDGWQEYAAATAAAFAKVLLNHLPSAQPTTRHTTPQDRDRLHQRLKRTTDREILDWLSSTSRFSEIQTINRATRVKDSGEWLVQDPRYLDWIHSGGLLWLYGVPGCGKSVLSSKIIDDLTDRCSPHTNFRVAYWYFSFADASTQGISYMLRSLLKQLIRLPLPEKIQRLWEDHHDHQTEPSHVELLDAISDLIDTYEHVYLLLDALDEYPSHARSTLLHIITQLLERHQRHLCLIVTSRNEPDIQRALESAACSSIDVQQASYGDVDLFIQTALRRISSKSPCQKLAAVAFDELSGLEEGHFRWMKLQIGCLIDFLNAQTFRRALDSLPSSLDETYRRALGTMPKDYQQGVRHLLMMLTSSCRELTVSEVIAAIPCVEDVLGICKDVFITIGDRDSRETITFAHSTVKDFFVSQLYEEGSEWWRFNAKDVDRFMTAHIIDCVFGYPLAGSRDSFDNASRYPRLTDHIAEPSRYFDFRRIVRTLEVNVAETILALLRKGPRQAISREVVHAIALDTSASAEISEILLVEDLASITITEELVHAAANDALNPRMIEVLVRTRSHEIPVSAQTLLAIGRRSTLALQFLVYHRMEDFYLILAQPESVHAIKEMIGLGLSISIDTRLIRILADRPHGSLIMKLLLSTRMMEHAPTKLDTILAARNFDLETLDLLHVHGRNDEDFVRTWKEARGVFYQLY